MPEPVCRGGNAIAMRYVEVWTNVFHGVRSQRRWTLDAAAAPSIDTGMGLERVTSVIQGKISNYDTDLFTPIWHDGKLAGRDYTPRWARPITGRLHGGDRDPSARRRSHRRRGLPSNEGRGYVLRKISGAPMRTEEAWTDRPVSLDRLESVLETMGGVYEELREKRAHIASTITAEEGRSTSC